MEEHLFCMKHLCHSVQVCLYFYNKLFRGNRVTKVDTGSYNAFASPNLDPLAICEVDITSKPQLPPLLSLSPDVPCFFFVVYLTNKQILLLFLSQLGYGVEGEHYSEV